MHREENENDAKGHGEVETGKECQKILERSVSSHSRRKCLRTLWIDVRQNCEFKISQ